MTDLNKILEKFAIHGLCHITGGGLIENVPRVIPDGYCVQINSKSWQRPAIFNWLQNIGQVEESEMLRVFNCGMGMLIMLPQEHATDVITLCKQNNHQAVQIGVIKNSSSEQKIELL